MTTPEENNAIARRFFDAAWNRGDLRVLDELVSPDSLDHSTVHGQTEKGTESFKQIITSFRKGIPDIQLTIEDEIYARDRVCHRWVLRGTHTGELMGVPPTGKKVQFTGMTIVRIENSKIAERWANVDVLALLQQIGAIPGPPK